MKNHTQRLLFCAAVVASTALAGCGSDLACGEGTTEKDGACVPTPDGSGSSSALTCGEGTVEKDSTCVPKDESTLACGEGTVEQAGKCVPKDPAAKVTCGDGTVEKDGVCSLDLDTVKDLLRPKVESVKLKRLVIHEEGQRPLVLLHKMTATLELEVVGEPFDTSAVLGLRSKDGKKQCLVGSFRVVHNGVDHKSGADQAASQLITLNEHFYIQPVCAGLVGEKDARAFVAFDPFNTVALKGRVLAQPSMDAKNPPKAEVVDAYMAQSELKLTDCKAGELSPHPNDCVAVLEINKSTGKDVEVETVKLQSSVAILDVVRGPGLEATAATTLTVDGEKVEHAAIDPKDYKSHAPGDSHVTINTEVLVYGLDRAKTDEVKDDDVHLTFAIRPVAGSVDLGDASTVVDDTWAPLVVESQKPGKAGEPPEVNKLDKHPLKSFIGASRRVQDTSLFFSEEAETKIARGEWSGFNLFEVQVCATASFTEGGVHTDAKDNNCRVEPIVVLRRHSKATYGGIGSTSPGTVAGATTKKGSTRDKNYGDGHKFAIKFESKSYSTFTAKSLQGDASAGMYLKGWYPLTLADVWFKAYDGFGKGVAGSADALGAGITLLGIKLPSTAVAIPDDFAYSLQANSASVKVGGVTVPVFIPAALKKKLIKMAEKLAPSKEGKKKCRDFNVGPIPMVLCANLKLTVGLDVAVAKQNLIKKHEDACKVGVKHGDTCFVAKSSKKSYHDARQACRDLGGELAQPWDLKSRGAVLQAMAKAKVSYARIGGAAKCNPKTMMIQARKDLHIYNNVSKSHAAKLNTITDCYSSWFSNAAYEATYYKGWTSAQKVVDACTLEMSAVDACKAQAKKDQTNHWRGTGFAGGALTPRDWAKGEPNDAGSLGEPSVMMHASGQLFDVSDASKRAYVCAVLPGGQLAFTVAPFADGSFVGQLGVTLFVARGGIEIDLDLLNVSFPASSGMRYWYDGSLSTVYLALFADLKAKISTLNGELSTWYQTWNFWKGDWGEDHKNKLFGWSGFVLHETTLWQTQTNPFSLKL